MIPRADGNSVSALIARPPVGYRRSDSTFAHRQVPNAPVIRPMSPSLDEPSPVDRLDHLVDPAYSFAALVMLRMLSRPLGTTRRTSPPIDNPWSRWCPPPAVLIVKQETSGLLPIHSALLEAQTHTLHFQFHHHHRSSLWQSHARREVRHGSANGEARLVRLSPRPRIKPAHGLLG